MSRTVDERVVEMRFDNQQFERNVKTSLSTLDKLKSALKLDKSAQSLEGLEKVGKNFNLDGVGKSVEYIASQFNILGRVGLKIKDDIASYVSNIIENFARLPKSLSLDQISSGWEKYGEKASSVQTIMAATGLSVEEVENQMRKLMWYTDETSYSFSDMSQNIGKFTNAGVDLGTATTAMIGISNWAGRSGANVNEASRAMYNLSQALAVGSVKLIDWKSIENANMATVEFKQTAIDTAVELGTLTKVSDNLYKTLNGTEVSATNFNEALSEGWFSSDVLLDTLNLYGEYTEEIYKNREAGELASETMERLGDMNMELGAAAFKAAQEYRKASDVIEATTDAVSTKWMGIFQLVFGNAEEAKRVWTELGGAMYDIFAAPLDTLTDLLEPAMISPIEQLKKELADAEVSYESFYKHLLEVGKARGEARAYENYGGGADEFGAKAWATRTDLVRALNKEIYATSVSVDDVNSSLDELSKLADEVIAGAWGNGEERIRRFAEANIDLAQVQELVNKRMAGEEIVLTDMTDAQLKNIGYTEEQIEKIRELEHTILDMDSSLAQSMDRMNKPSGKDLFFKSIQNIIEAGYKLSEVIGSAFRDIFPATTSERIYSVLESIESFTKRLVMADETAEKVRRTLRGFFAVLDIGWQTVKAVAGGIKNIIKAILPSSSSIDSIFNFTGNIADMLVEFDNMIKETGAIENAVGSVVSVITNGVRVTKEFLKEIPDRVRSFADDVRKQHPAWAANWDGFKTKVSEFVSDFGGNLKKAYKNFKDWSKNFKDSNVGGTIVDSLRNASGKAGETISLLWEKIKMAWDKVSPKLGKLFGYLGEQLSATWASIKEMLKNTDLEDWATALEAIFTGGIFLTIRKFVKKLTDGAGSFNGILEGIEQASKRFKDVVKAYSLEIKAEALKKVATAIAILAGSLWVIAKIPADDLGRAAGVLAGLLTSLTVVAALAQRFGQTSSLLANNKNGVLSIFGSSSAGFGSQLVKFAAALLVMAKAVKTLGSLDEKDLYQGMGAITVLMVEVTALVKLMPKETDIGRLGKVFKGIGTAMLLLAASFKLFETEDWGTIGKGAVVFTGTVALVTGAMVALSKAGTNAWAVETFGKTVRNIATAMLILTAAMKVAGTMSWTEIGMAVAAMAASLTLLGAAAYVVKKAGLADSMNSIGKAMLKFGGGLALAGLGLAAFTAGLLVLGTAGTVALAGVRILVEVLETILDDLIEWAIDATPRIATLLVTILTEAAAGLAEAAEDVVPSLVKSLNTILGTLAENIAPIIDNLITILVAVINGVADRTDDILGACANLLGSIIESIKTIFQEVDPTKFWSTVVGITLLAGVVKLLSSIKGEIKSALVSAGVMVLLVGAMAGIFYLIKDIDGVNTLAQATALSEIMLAMAAVIRILAGVNPAYALEAALSIGAFEVLFGAIEVFLGGLNELSEGKIVEMLEEGAEVTKAIAEGIGAIIGGLVGGAAGAAVDAFVDMADLPGIGTALSDFADNAGGFIDFVRDNSGLDFSVFDHIVGGVAVITATSFVDSLSDCLTSLAGGKTRSFATYAEELSDAVQYLDPFVKAVRGYTKEDTAKIADLGSAMAQFSFAVPKGGGFMSFLSGSQDFEKFGQNLMSLGWTLASFSKYIAPNIDSELVTASADAAGALSALAQSVPYTGGIWQLLIGEKDLGTFGGNLNALGLGMKEYARHIDGIDNDTVLASADTATALVELDKATPRTGGFINTFILGEHDLAKFGTRLSMFADALVDYSDKIVNANFVRISNSVSNIAPLFELATDYNPEDISMLADMASRIEDFGDKYQTFYARIEDASDYSKVTGMVAGIRSMITVAREYQSGDIEDLAKALDTLSTFSVDGMVETFENAGPKMFNAGKEAIIQFMNGIGESGSAFEIKVAAMETAGKFLDSIEGYNQSFYDHGTTIMSELLKGLKAGAIVASTWFTNLFEGAARPKGLMTIISEYMSDFQTKGEELIGKLISGFVDRSDNVWNTITALLDICITKIDAFYNSFKSSGSYLMDGLAVGIRNNSSVQTAMTNMANTAINTANRKFDINSPSKVFQQIGVYVVQGFANGVSMKKSLIQNTVSDTFNGALQGIGNAMRTQFGTSLTLVNENLRKFANDLYTQTNAYKQSVANIDAYKASIEELNAELAKQKEYKKTATNHEKLNNKISNYTSKINDYNSKIKTAQKEMASITKQQASDQKKLDKLYKKPASYDVQQQIADLEKQMKEREKQYKKDQQNISKWQKKVAELEAKKKDLENTLNTTADKSETKENIKYIKEQIAEANAEIKAEQEQMIRDMEDVFNDYVDSIKDNIKSYLDIFNLTAKAQIDLFSGVSNAGDNAVRTTTNILNVSDSLADNVKSINAETIESYKKLSESVSSSLKILDLNASHTLDTFSAFSRETPIAITTILRRMESQVSGLTDYYEKLDALASTGVSDALYKKLEAMGPSNVNYIEAFLKMTADEIEQANETLEMQSEMQAAVYLRDIQNKFRDVQEWAYNIQTLIDRGLDAKLLDELTENGVSNAEQVAMFVAMTDEQLAQLNNDYREAGELAASVTKQVAEATKKYAEGIEDAADSERKLVGQQYIDAMRQNTDEVKDWYDQLQKLSDRGVSSSLIKELADLGPSGAEQIAKFASMTDDELRNLNQEYLYSIETANDITNKIAKLTANYERTVEKGNILNGMKESVEAARDYLQDVATLSTIGLDEGLIREIKDLGQSGAETVKAFLAMSATEIANANDIYRDKVKVSNQMLANEMKDRIYDVKDWAAKISALAAKGANDDLIKQLVEKGPESIEYVEALLAMEAKELGEFNDLYKTSLELPDQVSEVVIASYVQAGINAANGFAEGLSKASDSVAKESVNLAAKALEATKKALGIASPSKEFAKLGNFSGMGFVDALTLYQDRAYDAAYDVADASYDGLHDALQAVKDMIDTDMDLTPVITPVIDMSEVNKGVRFIDSNFGGIGGISTVVPAYDARRISSHFEGGMADRNGSTDGGSGGDVYTFNQYNTSPKALSRFDIYRQTKNQLSMLKGVVNK